MASPPADILISFDPEIIALNILSEVLPEHAMWGLRDPEALGMEPGHAILAFDLVAPEDTTELGLAVEIPSEILVDSITGHIISVDDSRTELLGLVKRALSLASRAADDAAVTTFINDHQPTVARFDDIGGPGRIAVRPTVDIHTAPILFPSPG